MKYIFKFHLRIFLFLFLLTNGTCKKDQAKTTDKLTDDEIGMLIKKNSPLNGAKIPDEIKFRLWAAYVAGKYYLTDEPFLIEGCKAIQQLGLGIVKLWLQGDPEGEYPLNSKWNWEVYYNEPKVGVKDTLVCTTDEMRGFWLIQPDST